MVEKGSIFWEGGVDSGRVAHINWLKRGVCSGRRVDSGNRRHLSWKGGYILGGRGKFWEPQNLSRGIIQNLLRGRYQNTGRYQNLPGYSFKGGIIWGVTPVLRKHETSAQYWVNVGLM